MTPGLVTKEMKLNFHSEMRVMSALRHPNVVLFMGASSKPPRMCIIMEYMALGSLYDVRDSLHSGGAVAVVRVRVRCLSLDFECARGQRTV
jgi:serine/threonine protein kinase